MEHLVCSVPVRDYGFSYEDLRDKVEAVLSGLGVAGAHLSFMALGLIGVGVGSGVRTSMR